LLKYQLKLCHKSLQVELAGLVLGWL